MPNSTSAEQGIARRLQILRFIVAFVREEGVPPSGDEIAAGVGLAAHSGVAAHLAALERDGFIERKPGRYRSIRVTAKGRAAARA